MKRSALALVVLVFLLSNIVGCTVICNEPGSNPRFCWLHLPAPILGTDIDSLGTDYLFQELDCSLVQ